MLIHELPVFSPKKQRLKKMRGFLRKVRSNCCKNREYQERTKDGWCNLAHIHLDWHGYGDYSRQARLLFIQEYAKRFDQFAKMFIRQKLDFQLWILIHPYDSGADCLFYHTANPHTEFPITLHKTAWGSSPKHLFSDLLPQYTMFEGKSEDGFSLAYYAEGVGSPLR